MDIDFEGGSTLDDNKQDTPVTVDDNNQKGNVPNNEDVDSLSGEKSDDINDTTPPVEETDDSEDYDTLTVGDTVEVEGKSYTVAENGDLVDAEGNLFMEAAKVQDWLSNQEVDTDETVDGFDLESIKDIVGFDVTDDQGNVIEFDNTPDGVRDYIDAVIENKTRDVQEATLNKFFNDVPVVKEFLDYLAVNNGNPKGFGEIRDRSGVKIQQDNVAQQEAIIRAAAEEFGNRTLNDSYIKYLKDTGGLYNEAVAQLNNLIEKDKQTKQELAQRAQYAREQEQAELQAYWQNVNDVIASRSIGGYKIPESIIKTVNGQKVTMNLGDFYDYLSKPVYTDENGQARTGYQRDLDAMSDEDALNAELLDAWLHFTGGTYKDLIEMAVNKREVKTLKLKAQQNRTTKTVRINKANGNKSIDDIVLG